MSWSAGLLPRIVLLGCRQVPGRFAASADRGSNQRQQAASANRDRDSGRDPCQRTTTAMVADAAYCRGRCHLTLFAVAVAANCR